jgi:hypothetical protein
METEMMFFLSLLADKPFEDDTDSPKTLLILHYKNAIRRLPLTAKFIRSGRSARGARVKSIDQRHRWTRRQCLGRLLFSHSPSGVISPEANGTHFSLLALIPKPLNAPLLLSPILTP